MGAFVGHKRELAELTAALGKHRLVTLCGPGGMGKSRLAREYRAKDDAGTLVDVTASSGRESLRRAIATAVGAAGDLVIELRERPRLLVLDNCEHLIDTCAHVVQDLLTWCPKVRVLVTSRELLGVPGERALFVGPLPPADARQLFRERAREVDPDFELTPDHGLLCDRLDGLPLAVELAALRLPELSAARLLHAVDRPFSLLRTESARLPGRHRALDDVIRTSYAALTDDERAVFRQVSVFQGGFDLATAAQVCLSGTPVGAVLRGLQAKSLLVTEDPRADVLVFRQPALIRAFARERLGETSTSDVVHGRLVDALSDRLGEFVRHLHVSADLLRWIDGRERTILAAAEWAGQHHDPRRDLLVTAVATSWARQGNLTDACALVAGAMSRVGVPEHRSLLFERAASLANQRGAYADAAEWADRAVAVEGSFDRPAVLARNLRTLGYARYMLGDVEHALEYYALALESARQLGHRPSLLVMMTNFARRLVFCGEFDRAEALVAEAVTHLRADDEFRWSALRTLTGVLAVLRGDHAAADATFVGLVHRVPTDSPAFTTLVEGLGVTAVHRGQAERGVVLLAAADTRREGQESRPEPAWQQRIEDAMAMAADDLPVRDLVAARSLGSRLGMDHVADYVIGGPAAVGSGPPLTARQREVLASLVAGRTNAAIAADLGIAERTVDNHVAQMLARLGLRSRTQLAAWSSRRSP